MLRKSQRMRRRILHTSDLHLSSLADKACYSLVSLVELAIQTKVDLVIIAGDLFDHNRVDDELVSFAANQLRRLPVDAVILPGNHDCLTPDSVFERAALWQGCDNVRVFREPGGESMDLPGLGVSLWGKPIDSYDNNVLPLLGMPQLQQNGQWHIAVAHGYCVNNESAPFPSYNITEQEILASGCDYVALGHIITFRCVCDEPVKAYYSGSPAFSGTVAMVDLSEETGVRVTPYDITTE